MPTYSLFWDRHYKDIGNCCMTQPLDHPILVNSPTGGGVDAVHEEKYVQMIDVAWMNSEKIKWIGWDKQGYYAWITPKGMIYLFKDLKRNEKGKDWEKEHGTMRLPDDGQIQSFWPTSRDFYEWEKEVQENCGFCNDKKATPTTESDKESDSGSDKESDSEGLDLPAWKNLLDGGGLESRKKVTDTDDVSYTGFATDTSKIGYETYGAPYANGNDVDPSEYIGNHDASEYIGSNEYIGAYAPPPTTAPPPPTYTPPPRKQNPVVNTQKVLTAPKSPFEKKMQERLNLFEESAKSEFKWDGAPKVERRTPASVGANNPTATFDQRVPTKFTRPATVNSPSDFQTLKDGTGDLQKQDYTIEIPSTKQEFENFKNAFLKNPGSVTNNKYAQYNINRRSNFNVISKGDIIYINIENVIDCYVEIINVNISDYGFEATFQTLKGHPEAGTITFTAKYEDGIVSFNISSLTRQRYPLQEYISPNAKLALEGLARRIQIQQWEEVLKNVAGFFKSLPLKAGMKINHFSWNPQTNEIGTNFRNVSANLLQMIQRSKY